MFGMSVSQGASMGMFGDAVMTTVSSATYLVAATPICPPKE